MQHLKTKQYGPVKAFELGYHWPGLPTFTVHIYYIDGLLIDTGQYNCRHTVLSLFKQLPLQQIALTHWHEDHIGNVSTLYNHFHPTIFADPLTAEKVRQGFDIMLYEKYFFGKIRPQDIPIKTLQKRLKHPNIHSFLSIHQGIAMTIMFTLSRMKDGFFRRFICKSTHKSVSKRREHMAAN
jgi:glyoxylase-like metal-dependent hydrolase (beta-lactamase superfamily II)